MGLNHEEIRALAQQLDDAARHARPIPMLSLSSPLSLKDAYLIQRAAILLRAQRDERLVGMKMGLTSRAKMQQVGVHSPIYGHLTHAMRLMDGGTLQRADHCHPRVEPELAFLLKRDLRGPVSPAEALLAVEGVCAALEVIDSRYQDFKFTLPDVVADNASSSRFVLGSVVQSPAAFDISNLGMIMERNGVTAEIGSSAAIFDHPARSLAALANLLSEVGESLKAGQIVLAGGATAAIHLHPGDHVRLLVDGLGSAELRVA